MKKIILAFFCLSTCETTAFAVLKNEAQVISCCVEFEKERTIFDTKKLDQCLSQIENKKDLRFIQTTTSATVGGTSSYNQKLTDKRAAVLKAYLSQNFPSVAMKEVSIGKNKRYGKSGMITLVVVAQGQSLAENEKTNELQVTDQDAQGQSESVLGQQVASTIPMVYKQHNKPIYDFRFALRAGRDIYMRSSQAPYFSTGADASIFFPQNRYLRFEGGIQGSQLVNDNYLTLYTYYGFAGAYVTHSGVVLGSRALLGGVTNQDHQTDTDAGVELRAGYEYKDFSVFFGAGRTKDTARFGIDFGLKV